MKQHSLNLILYLTGNQCSLCRLRTLGLSSQTDWQAGVDGFARYETTTMLLGYTRNRLKASRLSAVGIDIGPVGRHGHVIRNTIYRISYFAVPTQLVNR